MPAQTILIISRDKDFSSVVAEQVRSELALATVVAENSAAAKTAIASASVIVTSEEIENLPCPVIVIIPPVRISQLLEDITINLQKYPADATLLGHGYSLQPRQKQLLHSSGKTIDLTDKEAQLLQTLAEAGSKGIAKDRLLKDVWCIEAELNTHTLETHIYRLRGKCKELAGIELIEAVEGGYALAGGE